MRPHTSRTWRTPIPRSHLAMPGVPSIGRTSMIAGASTAMSNLYCRTGEKEFAEKARPQPTNKVRCRVKLQERFGIGEREQCFPLWPWYPVKQKRAGRAIASGPILIWPASLHSKALLRHLTTDFAARIGRGVDVDVVLAGRQIGRLGVRQGGAALGGARACIGDRDGDAGILAGFTRSVEMRGGGGAGKP
jgi:hypothetical protein